MANSKYRDTQITALLKELRAEVKPFPNAARALVRVEGRLEYLLDVLDAWDATHARRAEELLRLGNTQAAALEAAMIFDEPTRHGIYDRAPVLASADEAAERIAANRDAGREVLV